MTTDYDSVELVDDDVVTPFAVSALLAALLGASALFAIPVPGSLAPVTLQTLVVFLAGILLGPLWGGFTVSLYIVAGALGAPVFAQGGAGIGYLTGAPTAGFIWSFLVATVLIGLLVHRGTDLRKPSSVPLSVLGLTLAFATLLIYAAGVGWFAWLTGTGLVESTTIMALPFVPGDLVKIAAAIAIVRSGLLDSVPVRA